MFPITFYMHITAHVCMCVYIYWRRKKRYRILLMIFWLYGFLPADNEDKLYNTYGKYGWYRHRFGNVCQLENMLRLGYKCGLNNICFVPHSLSQPNICSVKKRKRRKTHHQMDPKNHYFTCSLIRHINVNQENGNTINNCVKTDFLWKSSAGNRDANEVEGAEFTFIV